MNTIKKIDFYLKHYGIKPEVGDKVIKKDNSSFEFKGLYQPHVAEFIGSFDQGEKVYAVLRGINESGTFEIGVIDPEELYLV